MGDALPRYEHEPLSYPNSLRLLKLWHSDELTEEIVCDLFESCGIKQATIHTKPCLEHGIQQADESNQNKQEF